MRSFFKGFIFVLLASLIWTCSKEKCDDKVCPPINPKYYSMLPGKIGDSVVFKNDSGDKIVFTLGSVYIDDVARPIDCFTDKGHCYCRSCLPTLVYKGNTNDSSRVNEYYSGSTRMSRVETSLDVRVIEEENRPTTMLIFLFQSSFNISIDPPTSTNSQNVIPSFTVGNKTYNNVVEMEQESTLLWNGSVSDQPKSFVSKVYTNVQQGFIAFFDLKTNSLFYLE